jgi:hypothetical protein
MGTGELAGYGRLIPLRRIRGCVALRSLYCIALRERERIARRSPRSPCLPGKRADSR